MTSAAGWCFCLFAAFGVLPLHGQFLEFSCQAPPTLFLRLLMVHDNSASSASYNNNLYRSVLPVFMREIKHIFSRGVSVGCATFNSKDTKECFTEGSSLQDKLPSCDMDGPEVSLTSRSTADALFMATRHNWDEPMRRGRKIVVIFADHPSDLSVAGEPFDPLNPNCQAQQFPSPEAIADEYIKKYMYVIFVVPRSNLFAFKERYETLFDGQAAFVPKSSDSETQMGNLFKAFDFLYCGQPLPEFPTTTTSTSTTTTTTSACGTEGSLQILHLQDVSWSYKNDMINLKARMGAVMANLRDRFATFEVALGSFVDKPIGYFGYPGDYCYREELQFTTGTHEFVRKITSIRTLSGRDWKESQFDAIKYGVQSTTLGWKSASGARKMIRILMLATDAGPHVKGDLDMPPSPIDDCLHQPYPSEEEIKDILEKYDVIPIFIVTKDIYNYWTRIMNRISSKGKVVRLRDEMDETVAHILSAVDDICLLY